MGRSGLDRDSQSRLDFIFLGKVPLCNYHYYLCFLAIKIIGLHADHVTRVESRSSKIILNQDPLISLTATTSPHVSTAGLVSGESRTAWTRQDSRMIIRMGGHVAGYLRTYLLLLLLLWRINYIYYSGYERQFHQDDGSTNKTSDCVFFWSDIHPEPRYAPVRELESKEDLK